MWPHASICNNMIAIDLMIHSKHTCTLMIRYMYTVQCVPVRSVASLYHVYSLIEGVVLRIKGFAMGIRTIVDTLNVSAKMKRWRSVGKNSTEVLSCTTTDNIQLAIHENVLQLQFVIARNTSSIVYKQITCSIKKRELCVTQ